MPKGIPKHPSLKRTLLHRFRIARGHLDKVISMMQDDLYCIDVIHQSMAVQAALRRIDQEILRNHMVTCVTDAIKKGNTQDVVDEVMKVMKKQNQ